MKVKSFGCSFIFGTDLADDGRNGPWATASNFTWPALIAKELGWEYVCAAHGGSGNLQILARVLDETACWNADFYIIGWSWIDRFDYIDNTQERRTWHTLSPITSGSTARTYYRDLHSEYRDKLTSLTYVQTAIDELTRRGIPYLMTYMDDLMFCNRWNTSPGLSEMQGRIEPQMHTFENKNFLEWSKENNFPISKTSHPLEQAHSAAAEIMLPAAKSILKNHNLV